MKDWTYLISCFAMGFYIEYHSGINYIVRVIRKLALVFKKASNGTMYVCDIKALSRQLSFVNNEMLLSATVSQRLNSFAKREQIGIERALELQRSLAYPSRKELLHDIRNGTIINCTVTAEYGGLIKCRIRIRKASTRTEWEDNQT